MPTHLFHEVLAARLRTATYRPMGEEVFAAILTSPARIPDDRLFASIGGFLRGVDIVENELLDPATLPDPFGKVLHDYYAALDRYRLLTYGQQIVRAVCELAPPCRF